GVPRCTATRPPVVSGSYISFIPVVFVTSSSAAFFVFRFFFVIWNHQANFLLHDIVSYTINVNPERIFRSVCSLVNSLLYCQHPLQNIQQYSLPLPRIQAMVRH
ncbi:hypothetical protein C354_04219, partial [Cryptococcus neoformans MW-RSA1955]